MKDEEIGTRIPVTDGSRRAPIAEDSRPPEQTESTTRHVFLMRGSEFECSRCGEKMNDRTLDEICPRAV